MLFDRLHALHHVAGWPSLREMSKEIGCSHTTVSAAFSEPRTPRWGLLELIVETLGGDTEEFHQLWLAASRAADGPTESQPQAPASGPPDVPQPAPRTAPLAPRQLPADVPGFTGRAGQLAELDRLLSEPAPTVVISTVSGTAGVGKTALAVHWAHRVAHRFPDGQLYINLRGYDPQHPVPADQALEALLRELGVDGTAMPQELPQRAARYRTLLADRKMLILLDNAYSIDQVRDLLPGSPSCFVLVTSRASLPALVARYGAVRVNLDLLSTTEAVALLRTLVGARVDAEPERAVALAERCARLPLALRIAAELAVSRPNTSLAELVEELSEEPYSLDLLTTGDDDYTAVRTVFSWSCWHLGDAAVRAFHLLGLHPGRDTDRYAVAALTGHDPRTADRLLAELTRAHLVSEPNPGRYAMHDLLRAYAAEQGAALPEPERQAALDRLYDHYLHTAAAAMDAVYSHNRHHRPRVGPATTPIPKFADSAAARGWLHAEWRNLIASAQSAAHRRPDHTCRVAATIAGYLDGNARYDHALALHELARTAAVASGDRLAEGAALNHLAVVNRRLGRYQDAIALHQDALAVHRDIGDGAGEARALHGLGILAWRMGRYQQASEHLAGAVARYQDVADPNGEGAALYALGIASRRLGRYAEAEAYHRRSLEVLEAAGDRAGQAGARTNLGVVCTFLGRYDEAIDHHTWVLALQRELDDRLGQGVALDNLGTAYRRMGRYPEAESHHRQALQIFREIGYRVGEGDSLHGLGVVVAILGRYAEATGLLEQAIEIGRALGEADVETGALIDLGEVRRALGRTDEAAAHYRDALRLAERSEDRYEKARALSGTAQLRYDAGDRTGAAADWTEALTVYADLGLPDAEAVRARLATVAPVSDTVR
ncbi:MAG: ATP-binding protein [Micromonosporaceae bacterium]